jgi:hypothetical protein
LHKVKAYPQPLTSSIKGDISLNRYRGSVQILLIEQFIHEINSSLFIFQVHAQ